MNKKLIKKVIITISLTAVLSCLLPFVYFVAFPATEETSKKATQVPKGIIAEFCFNFETFKSERKVNFLMDFRWSAPGSFAVSMPSPYFTRCGYIPWMPFISYPEIGYIGIPRFRYTWGAYCLGNCP
jgi:hypothetical protein